MQFTFSYFANNHFTFVVTGGNEVGTDLVLIQPFLLYYVNLVLSILNSIFLGIISIRKGKRFGLASLSLKGQDAKPTTVKWPILETPLQLNIIF